MKRPPSHRETETTILERMETTRRDLLSANSLTALAPATRHSPALPVGKIVSALAETPRVALLLAFCVGVVVLGPKRTLRTAARAGATAWVTSSARKFGQRMG